MGIMLVILLFGAITNGVLMQSKSLSLRENHLVPCLTYISLRYFTPRRPLMISSPSTYRDVQQELIEEIHLFSMWPLVVSVDGNINKYNKTDFIDRNGSYLILIPDGNIKSFQVEFNGLAQEGEYNFIRKLNSESLFVVAGANNYTMQQQTNIFDYFSKRRIYNCIIVSQVHDKNHKEYSKPKNNDVDTDITFGVYTWFPYHSSGLCSEVKYITLLDSWVISAEGHFTKNTDLFPIKIRNSFNGYLMKAVLRDGYGFVTTYYINVNVSSESDITGFEMDLLRIILKQMSMTFAHVPTPEGFEIEEGSVKRLFTTMIAK